MICIQLSQQMKTIATISNCSLDLFSGGHLVFCCGKSPHLVSVLWNLVTPVFHEKSDGSELRVLILIVI